MAVNSFTEDSSAEEIIEKLDEYIPYLDEDRQFIRKYRSDFLYHYSKDFCNLALFSFHYIYMFIINTSMVKYYAFDENIIRNQTGNKDNKGLELFFYFGHQPEKKVIHNGVISEINRERHISNVDTRNNIAHSSGIVVPKKDLIAYINNCFSVIDELQTKVIKPCCTNLVINKRIHNYNSEIVDSLCLGNTEAIENMITDFMKDLHLSYKDIISLNQLDSELNAISYFTPYIYIDEYGYCLLDWDSSLNLHQAIYDDFCSKYEKAKESTLPTVLNEKEIWDTLKISYTKTDRNTLYNVYHKLIENSQYWEPVNIQTIKENINV